MPRVQWPLLAGRPNIEVYLTLARGAQPVSRTLLADTGAGMVGAGFEILLDDNDCFLCGGKPGRFITLGGSYTGSYPVYPIRIRLPALGFDQLVRVVGVPTVPAGFDGIACFPFLNRFSYGNFADSSRFGLEI